MILFIFLSRQMIDIWLPGLINRYKHKSTEITPNLNPARYINTYFDGKVNIIVGWALFATISKYEKKALRSEGNRDNNITDIIDVT